MLVSVSGVLAVGPSHRWKPHRNKILLVSQRAWAGIQGGLFARHPTPSIFACGQVHGQVRANSYQLLLCNPYHQYDFERLLQKERLGIWQIVSMRPHSRRTELREGTTDAITGKDRGSQTAWQGSHSPTLTLALSCVSHLKMRTNHLLILPGEKLARRHLRRLPDTSCPLAPASNWSPGPVGSAPEMSPSPPSLQPHYLRGNPSHFSSGTPPVSDLLSSVCPSPPSPARGAKLNIKPHSAYCSRAKLRFHLG